MWNKCYLSWVKSSISDNYSVPANGKGWRVCIFSPKGKMCSNTDNLMRSTFLEVKAACYEIGPNPTHSGPAASTRQWRNAEGVPRSQVTSAHALTDAFLQRQWHHYSNDNPAFWREAFSLPLIVWSRLSLGTKSLVYRKNIGLTYLKLVRIGGRCLDRWTWE